MNRYAHSLLALSLVGALAACAPATDEPAAATQVSVEPTPSMSTPVPPTASEISSPTPGHDMTEMDGSGQTAAVEIVNFAFEPAELLIEAGTEITFVNLDSAPHTVTAGSGDAPMSELFDSGLLQQGESFSFVFDEPGTFAYFCDRHPPMEGSITVEE